MLNSEYVELIPIIIIILFYQNNFILRSLTQLFLVTDPCTDMELANYTSYPTAGQSKPSRLVGYDSAFSCSIN